jgi:hypothetical protein
VERSRTRVRQFAVGTCPLYLASWLLIVHSTPGSATAGTICWGTLSEVDFTGPVRTADNSPSL